MNYKKYVTVCIAAMCCVFMGCGADAQPESEMEVSTESDKSSMWDALHVASQKYFVQENYEISGDALFLPISVEAVSNGDYDETVFTEYVCVSDKTVWLQSYKSYYGGRRGGLGESMVQMYDSDGKPKLYEGDLDELFEKYGVLRKDE